MSKITVFKNIFDLRNPDEYTLDKNKTVKEFLDSLNFSKDNVTDLCEVYDAETGKTRYEPVLNENPENEYNVGIIVNNELVSNCDYEIKDTDLVVITIYPANKEFRKDWEANYQNTIEMGIGALTMLVGGAVFIWGSKSVGVSLIKIGATSLVAGAAGWGAYYLNKYLGSDSNSSNTGSSENNDSVPSISGSNNQDLTGNAFPLAIGDISNTPFVIGSMYTELEVSSSNVKSMYGYNKIGYELLAIGYSPLYVDSIKFDQLTASSNPNNVLAGKLTYQSVTDSDSNKTVSAYTDSSGDTVENKFNGSTQNTEIGSMWDSNKVDLEICQLGKKRTVYPYTIKQKDIGEALLYCYDKKYQEVASSSDYITYQGASWPSGYRLTPIYFTEGLPYKIAVGIQFPNGLYGTYTDSDGTAHYNKIPMNLIIQWRPVYKYITESGDSELETGELGAEYVYTPSNEKNKNLYTEKRFGSWRNFTGSVGSIVPTATYNSYASNVTYTMLTNYNKGDTYSYKSIYHSEVVAGVTLNTAEYIDGIGYTRINPNSSSSQIYYDFYPIYYAIKKQTSEDNITYDIIGCKKSENEFITKSYLEKLEALRQPYYDKETYYVFFIKKTKTVKKYAHEVTQEEELNLLSEAIIQGKSDYQDYITDLKSQLQNKFDSLIAEEKAKADYSSITLSEDGTTADIYYITDSDYITVAKKELQSNYGCEYETTNSNPKWNGATCFSFGDLSCGPNAYNKSDSDFTNIDNVKTEMNFEITATLTQADILELINKNPITNGINQTDPVLAGKAEVEFNSVEVRVLRLTPCYIDKTSGTGAENRSYSDVVKWSYLKTYCIDSDALKDACETTDTEVVGSVSNSSSSYAKIDVEPSRYSTSSWNSWTISDYYQKPLSAFNENKLVTLGVKVYPDKLGYISSNMEKINVKAHAITPGYLTGWIRYLYKDTTNSKYYYYDSYDTASTMTSGLIPTFTSNRECWCLTDETDFNSYEKTALETVSGYSSYSNYYYVVMSGKWNKKIFPRKIEKKTFAEPSYDTDGSAITLSDGTQVLDTVKMGNNWTNYIKNEMSRYTDDAGRWIASPAFQDVFIGNNAISQALGMMIGQSLGREAYGYNTYNTNRFIKYWVVVNSSVYFYYNSDLAYGVSDALIADHVNNIGKWSTTLTSDIPEWFHTGWVRATKADFDSSNATALSFTSAPSFFTESTSISGYGFYYSSYRSDSDFEAQSLKEAIEYTDSIDIGSDYGAHPYYCNLYVYQQQKVSNLFSTILAAGRAYWFYNENGQISIHNDRPLENPVMLISDENCLSFSYSRSFNKGIAGFHTSYADETNGGKTSELYILRQGQSKENPTRDIEDLSISGVTSLKQAWDLSCYFLGQRITQRELWTCKLNHLGRQLTIGSLVEFQNSTIQIGTDVSGRIQNLLQDDTYIYGFVIDQMYDYLEEYNDDGSNKQGCSMYQPDAKEGYKVVTVRFANKTQQASGISLTASDGTEYTQIKNLKGKTNLVLFEKKIIKATWSLEDQTADEDTSTTLITEFKPKIGDVIAFGYVGSITSKAVVSSITPDDKGNFTIAMYPYNEDLYTAGSGLPVFKTNLTKKEVNNSLPKTEVTYNTAIVASQSTTDASFNNLKDKLQTAIESVTDAQIENAGTPDNLTGLKAIPGKDGIALSWDIPEADGYRNMLGYYTVKLWRNYNSETPGDPDFSVSTNTNSYTYSFIRSKDGYPEADGFSTYHIEVNITNIGSNPAETPAAINGSDFDTSSYGTWLLGTISGIKMVASSNKLAMSWNYAVPENFYGTAKFTPVLKYNGTQRTVSSTTNYETYYSLSSNRDTDGYPEKTAVYTELLKTVPTATCIDLYTLSVKVENSECSSALSKTVDMDSTAFDTSSYGTWVPAAPAKPSIVASKGKLSLSWTYTAPDNFYGSLQFKPALSNNGKSLNVAATADVFSTYNLTDYPEADALAKYTLAVTAVNTTSGYSAVSSDASTVNTDSYGTWIPGAPSNLKITAHQSYITLSWSAGSTSKTYYGSSKFTPALTRNGTALTVTDITDSTATYTFVRKDDGYPEKKVIAEALESAGTSVPSLEDYDFTVTAKDVYSGVETKSSTDRTIDDSAYGTWQPGTPDTPSISAEKTRLNINWNCSNYTYTSDGSTYTPDFYGRKKYSYIVKYTDTTEVTKKNETATSDSAGTYTIDVSKDGYLEASDIEGKFSFIVKAYDEVSGYSKSVTFSASDITYDMSSYGTWMPGTAGTPKISASKDKLSLSWASVPVKDDNDKELTFFGTRRYEYTVCYNSKSNVRQSAKDTVNLTGSYDFVRVGSDGNTLDGYPESSDISASYIFSVKVYDTQSGNFTTTDFTIDDIEYTFADYGTWYAHPVTAVTLTASNKDYLALNFTRNLSGVEVYGDEQYTFELFKGTTSLYTKTVDADSISATYMAVYYFDRDIDGFPEKSDLANYVLKVTAINKTSSKTRDAVADSGINTDSYLTWIPASVKAVTVAKADDKDGIDFEWTADENEYMYGSNQYVVVVTRPNGLAQKTFTTTEKSFKYEFDRSEDGYPEADTVDDYSINVHTINPSVTTEGQNKTTDAASGVVDVTGYGTWIVGTSSDIVLTPAKDYINIAWSYTDPARFYGSRQFKGVLTRKGGYTTEFTVTSPNYTYKFNRDEDGYPEEEDFDSYSLTLVTSDAVSGSSNTVSDIKFETTSYGTWLPSAPVLTSLTPYKDCVVLNWTYTAPEKTFYGDLSFTGVLTRNNHTTEFATNGGTLSYTYAFVRSEDGYPEREDFANYKFAITAQDDISGKTTVDTGYTSENLKASAYGTWKPGSVTKCIIYPFKEYMTLNLTSALDTTSAGRTFYGQKKWFYKIDVVETVNGEKITTNLIEAVSSRNPTSDSVTIDYYYDRNLLGYPEAEEFTSDATKDKYFIVTTSVEDAISNNEGDPLESCSFSTVNYGTWVPPAFEVNPFISEDNIEFSYSLSSNSDKYYGQPYTASYQLSRDNGETWVDVTNDTYEFDREKDGYPERDDFNGKYQFKATLKCDASGKTNTAVHTEITKDDFSTLYTTWKVSEENFQVTSKVIDRTVIITPALTGSVMGKTSYRFSIRRCPRNEDDTEWVSYKTIDTDMTTDPYYAPNLRTDNVYPVYTTDPTTNKRTYTATNIDNYRDTSAEYVETTGILTQTLTLYNQGTSSGCEVTYYQYYIVAVNESGSTCLYKGTGEAETDSEGNETGNTLYYGLTVQALCTALRDIVEAKADYQSLYVGELSAITANLGQISDGSLYTDKYNYWYLSDATDDSKDADGNPFLKGAFRVGNDSQYLKVTPYKTGKVDSTTGEDVINTDFSLKLNTLNITSTAVNFISELFVETGETNDTKRVALYNNDTWGQAISFEVAPEDSRGILKLWNNNFLLTNDLSVTQTIKNSVRVPDDTVIYALLDDTNDNNIADGTNSENVTFTGSIDETESSINPYDKQVYGSNSFKGIISKTFDSRNQSLFWTNGFVNIGDEEIIYNKPDLSKKYKNLRIYLDNNSLTSVNIKGDED